ncbi:MAG: DNA-protecting protein DprA [Pseudomonadota bacterium]
MGGSRDPYEQLRLIRSPNIGPVSYRQLIGRFGSAKAALEAFEASVARDLQFVEKFGGRHIFIGDPEYPTLLSHLDNAPPVLRVKGDLGLLNRVAISIVGARNASAGACQFARQLAYDLGQMEFPVVSGLARGIDTAAHAGSIESGTIAVIAGGLDVVYPPENKAPQDAIAERGLLIAEQPPGTEPRARHFPYRNRIIAGISAGTVVVEAGPKSGSLITGNQLIREGATLVQNAEEIAELVRPLDHRMRAAPARYVASEPATIGDGTDGERQAVIDLMGMTYVSVNELVRQSGSSQANVQMVLLEMELAGKLERGAGGKVRIAA